MFRVNFARSVILGVALMWGSVACRGRSTPAGLEQQPDPRSDVLLAGDFQRVVKPATGRAEITRSGDSCELRLTGVSVAASGPVRVYLVGTEHADTTRAVVEAELKYDMAQLDQDTAEQTIALPSVPDPRLRSVVLYEPVFAVNLAYAALQSPPGAPR
jgi:hypothetical protein